MKGLSIKLTKAQQDQIKKHTGRRISTLSLLSPKQVEKKLAMRAGPLQLKTAGPIRAMKGDPSILFGPPRGMPPKMS